MRSELGTRDDPLKTVLVAIGATSWDSSWNDIMSESKSIEKLRAPDVNVGDSTTYTDSEAEKSFVRKIDFIVLPTLCLVRAQCRAEVSEWLLRSDFLYMYFFDCMDRVSPWMIGSNKHANDHFRAIWPMQKQTASIRISILKATSITC